MNNFDWSDLAFASKKELSNLNATFIAAPRQISIGRFSQLVQQFLPKGNIVLGIAKEDFIDGFEGQPHFRTLKHRDLKSVIGKVNQSKSHSKIYVIDYFQRETDYLLQKLKFQKVIFVRGSWHYAFHNLSAYYLLANQRIYYELVSPFANESEAKAYDVRAAKELLKTYPDPKQVDYSELGMMGIAATAAKFSFDYNYQTGVALAKKNSKGYSYIARAFNKVVPYQSYAMLNGASREVNFSPPNDLNYYDTVHAEVNLVIKAQKDKIDLNDTSLFINLLPCPVCARMLSQTDIQEFVYSDDHSNGYAIKMLELAGKKVRRVVP